MSSTMFPPSSPPRRSCDGAAGDTTSAAGRGGAGASQGLSGWFAVAWSDDLASGALRSLRYFERELVLFRGEDGAAHMLDACAPGR
jgi:hypothetical protein